MIDPFLIEQPFVVSFSGGRTSGYMLRRILDAYGGSLPRRGHVIFANTGKERPETLDFVERVSLEWEVPITWLEYKTGELWRFREVNYATASRNGEPFLDLLAWKRMLPNPVMRFCTQWLKIKPSNRYTRHLLGYTPRNGGYTNAIGLRADEPRRYAKLRSDPKSTLGETPVAPLFRHGVTKDDVMNFWAKSPFDLKLQPHEGNCDLCFLKSRAALEQVLRDRPDLAGWWIEREQQFQGKTRTFEAGRFRKDRPSVAELLKHVQEQPLLPLDLTEENYPECRCTD